MSDDLTIIRTDETIFFSHYQGVLREWIQVTLLNGLGESVAAEVKITAGDEEVTTSLVIAPGEQVYRCYAPVLWPHKTAEMDALVALTAGTHQALATVSVGTHRPWIVYLLADVCTDATWVYADFKDARKDDADLTYAELMLAESTRSSAPENRNHYNLVHALELDYFEEFYPEHKTRLVDAIRRGEITLNPFLNMTLTQNVSLEEQIRHFYVGRRWAVEYNLEMAYANHQETPSISWDMPGLLEGSGVRHLIKAILPYECPWAAQAGRASVVPMGRSGWIAHPVPQAQLGLRRREICSQGSGSHGCRTARSDYPGIRRAQRALSLQRDITVGLLRRPDPGRVGQTSKPRLPTDESRHDCIL